MEGAVNEAVILWKCELFVETFFVETKTFEAKELTANPIHAVFMTQWH